MVDGHAVHSNDTLLQKQQPLPAAVTERRNLDDHKPTPTAYHSRQWYLVTICRLSLAPHPRSHSVLWVFGFCNDRSFTPRIPEGFACNRRRMARRREGNSVSHLPQPSCRPLAAGLMITGGDTIISEARKLKLVTGSPTARLDGWANNVCMKRNRQFSNEAK